MKKYRFAKSSISKSNRSSLFFQYFLLFFVAAFVPIFIAVISLSLSYQSLKKEVMQSNQASVLLIQQSFDTKIKELEDTCLVLEQDPTVTRFALITDQLEAIRTLNSTVSHHDLLDNIIIKVRTEDYLFSSLGSYSLEDQRHQHYMRNLEQNGYSVSEWLELVNTVSAPTFWPVNALNATPNHLYLFIPMNTSFQSSGQNISRTIVFLIRQDSIRELFYASQTNANENILLLDADMNLLSFVAPHVSADAITELCEHLRAHTEVTKNGYYGNIRIDGQNNLIFISHSQKTGLYYVRFLPRHTVYKPLYAAITCTMIVIILDIFVGIMLIIFGIRRSYTPIRSLADWIQSNYTDAGKTNNEIRLFKNVFDDILNKNALMSQTIKDSRHELSKHLLTSLIRGSFSTEESFHSACKNLSICLEKKYWTVCSLLIENLTVISDKHVNFDSILNVMCADLPHDLRFQAMDSLINSKIIAVLNSDSDNPAFYRTVMEKIKKNLFEQKGLIASIGIGSIYDSYELVGKSYIESVNALDYRLIYGKNCLITSDICDKHTSVENYPSSDLDLLYTALMSLNTEVATATIHRIHDFTKSENCSLHIAKYICYDTISILKKIPKFLNTGNDDTFSQTLNIVELTNFETIDDFFASLMEVIHTTINSVTEKKAFTNNNLSQELIAYIHGHCFSYDFQINHMADHFSISPQYMRVVFKEHTGISISEYVSNIKMAKAMQLLRETDMNLQNIVNEIGNTDVSGFVRSFKKKTGITPGEYRKMNRL